MQSVGLVLNQHTERKGPDRAGNLRSVKIKLDRRRQAQAVAVLILCCLAVGSLAGFMFSTPAENHGEQYGSGRWYSSAYAYRSFLKIENTGSANELYSGYPVAVTVECQSLVAGGKLRGDYNDLRIAYYGSGDASEVARNTLISHPDAAHITIYFQLADSIPAGKASYAYCLYYGSPNATAPMTADFNVTPQTPLSLSVSVIGEEAVPEFCPAAAVALSIAAFIVFISVSGRIRKKW